MSAIDADDGAPVEGEDQESEAEESGCESVFGPETAGQSDEEEDDNWSGENSNLEELVISAVGTDYSLAAFLIPLLHRDFNLALKSKVESWRCATTARGGPDNSVLPSETQSSSTENSPKQDRGSSRKRRRTNSDDGNEGNGWDEDEDEDGRGKSGNAEPSTEPPADRSLLLACPFHKQNPIRYGVNGMLSPGKKPKYRACAGPGFKSIQRLKEHLKRVHSPVQCERCKMTFNVGKDRAQALTELAEHRKREEPCELRDASLKEGVDEAQWAKLEKQNRRRNQEVHRVEKWFEMWDILFPGSARPDNPWHEAPARFGGMPKDGEDYFAALFLQIFDHKLQQGDITLPEPDVFDRDELRERLRGIVESTFRMYVSIRENFSLESSSSGASNNRPSHLGVPSTTQRSSLGTTASHQATTATAATSMTSPHQQTRPAAPSNAYALDPSSYRLGMASLPAQPMPPPMPPMSSAAGLHPFGSPIGAEDIHAAGAFPPLYYPMFPAQGPCPWVPSSVQESVLPGAQPWFFDESQNYEPGTGDGSDPSR
ncbi:POZ-AT hook-and zinc finger-containing protein 1 [Achaetomium macrosporum]|uniref:POZ-AT hook-and zinc finger-containing protein 1 n=1 Tax=Achaetomium macrosporum TaxID=79813 RepID=A0AAN7H578_9PEZI|nr:POZ-AT hook-and zinc finger-containing protein 1 [Achaetomium macrosporum]